MNEGKDWHYPCGPWPDPVATPGKGRPRKRQPAPMSSIDMKTLEKALGVAHRAMPGIPDAARHRLALDLAYAWGSYQAMTGSRKSIATHNGPDIKPTKPATARTDGLLIRDCARALQRAGYPHTGIWGDGGDVDGVSNCIVVANDLLHAMPNPLVENYGQVIGRMPPCWRCVVRRDPEADQGQVRAGPDCDAHPP